MKTKSILVVLLIALLAISCAPKEAKTVEAAPAAAPAAVVPADIKDVAAWTAAYDSVIAQYTEVAAKMNAGDPSVMNKGNELLKTSSELDAVAETIKATLTGQELTDFTAKIQEYKDKFTAAAATN